MAGLFSESSAFRVAAGGPGGAPALAAPAFVPHPRSFAARAAADADSDDERVEKRKRRRRDATVAAAAAAATAAGAAEAAATAAGAPPAAPPKRRVEPAEAASLPAKKRKRTTPVEATADDADKAARTVFVGNLPAATTKKRLRQLFAPCGGVQSSRIRSAAADPEAKLPRKAALLTGRTSSARDAVNGYVVFTSADAVAAALALNGTTMDGRHVRVDTVKFRAPAASASASTTGRGSSARPPAPPARPPSLLDPKRCAYLGNLSFAVDDEEVWAAFSACGAVEAVRVPRDPITGLGRGFGYVLFKDAACVGKALGLAESLLSGRPVRVARASARVAAAAAAAPGGPAAAAAAAGVAARAAVAAGEAAGVAAGKAAAAAAPGVARWKAREIAATAAAAATAPPPQQAAQPRNVSRSGAKTADDVGLVTALAAAPPAPWEGRRTADVGPLGVVPLGGATAAASTGRRVGAKARWRDVRRESAADAPAAPQFARPGAPSPGAAAAAAAAAARRKEMAKPRAGRPLGQGKDGGVKRVSGRKRPAVVARKAAVARKKAGGG